MAQIVANEGRGQQRKMKNFQQKSCDPQIRANSRKR
jgi:hypothetical protein